MKILIAEDDLTSRMVLGAVLTKWGYEVTSTTNGDEALAVLQQGDAPQLAMLDWEMPGLDGVTLCRELRRQKSEKPLYLILLTSRADSNDIVRGLEAGADDYVAKPYNNEELQARINAGRRIIELQNQVRNREKLQGVLEMAGAVCHEINQPLQAVSGWVELLLMDMEPKDSNHEALSNIKEGMDRIGALTQKIMAISKYRTKEYMDGRRMIIDIDQSSTH